MGKSIQKILGKERKEMTLFYEYLLSLPKILLFCAVVYLLLSLGIFLDRRSKRKEKEIA